MAKTVLTVTIMDALITLATLPTQFMRMSMSLFKMPPSIFIVPGFYEGPEVFEPLATVLRHQGFPVVHITSLRSTGTQPPGNPTMDEDITAIAAELVSVVEDAGAEGV
jgi:hypothetical protein